MTKRFIPLSSRLMALLAVLLLPAASAFAQKNLPLDSAAGVEAHNASLEPAAVKGKKAIRMTISDDAQKRLDAMRARQQAGQKKAGKKGGGPGEAARLDVLAVVKELEFQDGVIELDLMGEPGEGATGGARGFVGVTFRVQPDMKTYDCFYLRPTNGRADDQERRNHTAQYMAHPDYPWFRLREETPSKYESWADIGEGEWIHVKIEVRGEKAKLFVNNSSEPTLIINDVKSGAGGKGRVALWIEGSTVAHFANLKITP